jgi:hypothetical protein
MTRVSRRPIGRRDRVFGQALRACRFSDGSPGHA